MKTHQNLRKIGSWDVSWARLGLSWLVLSLSWSYLGLFRLSWAYLGSVLGSSGSVLSLSGTVLGLSCACLGLVLARLGLSWACLGLSWARLGPVLKHFCKFCLRLLSAFRLHLAARRYVRSTWNWSQVGNFGHTKLLNSSMFTRLS